MSGTTYKMATVVGESADSIEDAVREALRTSARNVEGQTWAEIKDLRANINESGGVDRWQVKVDVAFEVKD